MCCGRKSWRTINKHHDQMNKITVTEEQASKFAKLHHGVSAASHLIADMQATLQSFADDVLAPALSQHPTILSAVKDEPFIHPGSFDPVPDFDLNAHLAKSGFVLAPGQAWHKPELFTVEDLAEGMRPLLVGEIRQKEDETRFEESGSKWGPTLMAGYSVPAGSVSLFRARRPLPAPTPDTFEAHGYTWTRHTPGDPRPCDIKSEVYVLWRNQTIHGPHTPDHWYWTNLVSNGQALIIGWRYADAEKPDEIPWIEWHGGPCPLKDEEVEEWERQYRNGTTGNGVKPSAFDWLNRGWNNDIIAYRVLKWREKKPKVPLGPEDVPPGSVFCVKDRMPGTWHGVLGVYASTVQLDTNRNTYSFYELQQEEWLINRSIPMTGKWDANAWEACEK